MADCFFKHVDSFRVLEHIVFTDVPVPSASMRLLCFDALPAMPSLEVFLLDARQGILQATPAQSECLSRCKKLFNLSYGSWGTVSSRTGMDLDQTLGVLIHDKHGVPLQSEIYPICLLH
jgi:hypothetical protein